MYSFLVLLMACILCWTVLSAQSMMFCAAVTYTESIGSLLDCIYSSGRCYVISIDDVDVAGSYCFSFIVKKFLKAYSILNWIYPAELHQ